MNNKKYFIVIGALLISSMFSAQFRNKERVDRLEGFDQKPFSWGFFLAANNFDYKLTLDPVYGMSEDKKHNLIDSKSSYGFGAGLIGKMRLNDYLDLRLEPGLQFVSRELTFNTQANDRFANGNSSVQPFEPIPLAGNNMRTVKSTYIDIPLLLEFHGNRWFNSRPYAAAGLNYLVNLQSQQSSENDNQQGVFRTTTHNFGWSAEIGMQFYFSRFKLTPAFRGTFLINNEMVSDNPMTPPYWAAGISQVNSRAFMFVLKFE